MTKPIKMRRYDALLALIEIETDDCVDWPYGTSQGYGVINMRNDAGEYHRIRTHVLALLTLGPQPDGHYCLHSCDRPVCVNLRHLRWGTPAENVADMDARNRRTSITGTTHRNPRRTLLSREQGELIKDLYVPGSNYPHPGSSKSLAERFDVSRQTIADITHGREPRYSSG